MTTEEKCPAVPNLANVPGIPRDEDGVVFAAPWEAKAFALVVHLHQRGSFAWNDWVNALSGEIAADQARAEPTPYYLLWLTAAERLIASRGLVDADQLAAAREALHEAQRHAHDDHDHHHDHGHQHEHGDHHHH
jgi:nitrile hydratase accessory protein